ncbi:hypothetical protein KVT40_005444 [Elsinoe batatas]|uniref:Rhodopsin domain-containing protein n=1 Tax=Elsinoe batatas TaxID=2601811 RepID=A0A8K0L150_9PEZI|nr:hypothetical protein KVT40_005444 [Elsinoe batatas]
MEGRAAGFLACNVICLLMTWVAVPLRCYARRRVIARLAAEDWIMVVAQSLFTWEVIGCFLQIAYGMGTHQHVVTVGSMERAFFLLFIGTHLYATVMMLARVSIGLLLLRLMASRKQKVVVWSVMALNVITWLVYVIWTFNICSPVSRYWQWSSDRGICRTERYSIGTYIHSAATVISDWTLSLIPMWVLYKSNLAKKTRFATAGILGLGALASIATVIRLVEVNIANGQGVGDFLYTVTDVLTWSIAEQGLAIVAGCLATFRPLFVKVTRPTEPSDGTRGRPGRPPQPGDTQVDWDPGLTIGFIASTDEEEGRFGKIERVHTHTIVETSPIGIILDRADSRTPLQAAEKTKRQSIVVIAQKEGWLP